VAVMRPIRWEVPCPIQRRSHNRRQNVWVARCLGGSMSAVTDMASFPRLAGSASVRLRATSVCPVQWRTSGPPAGCRGSPAPFACTRGHSRATRLVRTG
jgi:hypothetical protein